MSEAVIRALLLATASLSVALLCESAAASVALDRDFGIDGVTLTDIGPGNSSEGRATAIQADGKLIVAGVSYSGNDTDFAVVRYDADGTLDPTFGRAGIAIAHVGTGGDDPSDVAIQTDGRIVVAGSAFDDEHRYRFALARYNDDGALDPTFGNDGVVLTAVGLSFDSAHAVAIQRDGKIVAAGTSSNQSDYDIVLVRYNVDGSLDTVFGDGGIARTRVGASDESASSIVIQGDGTIVVAGNTDNGVDDDVVVIRYLSDGSLDASFGENGVAIATEPHGSTFPRTVVVQDDAKLVVGAWGSNRGVYQLVVLRFAPDGSLDPSFGADGIVSTDAFDFPGGVVAMQSDGKIVATATNGDAFTLIRYSADGEVDRTFGVDGIATTDPGVGGGSGALDVAIRDDDRIVAVGRAQNGRNGEIAALQFLADGSIDASFGVAGVARTLAGRSSDTAYDIAVQPDGKIVAAGTADGNFTLVRYSPDGLLDTSFDSDGIAVRSLEGDVNSVAIQGDGKIVAARSISAGGVVGGDFALVRHNTDGSIDASFGMEGIVTTAVGPGYDHASDVAVQPDGNLVVGGWAYSGVDFDFALARWKPDGALDADFGVGGVVTTPIGQSLDYAFGVALQADAKIVLAGTARRSDDQYAIAVARYNADGSVDTSFGEEGRVITELSAGYDLANDVAVQEDGKIVVAGRSDYAESAGIAVVRYMTDGSLDSSFGVNGVTTTELALTGDGDVSLALDGDSRLLVAVTADKDEQQDFVLLRYDPNGNLDASFGDAGIESTDLGASSDVAYSVAIDPNGRLVVGGSYSGPLGFDFAVARYVVITCGDTTSDGSVSATDALVTLAASLGAATCELCSCDVNGSGDVTATDALLTLQLAVGLSALVGCGAC